MDNRQPSGGFEQRITGKCGKDIILNTDALTGKKYGCLHFLEDSVIASATDNQHTGNVGAYTSLAVPKGFIIWGDFTAITLTSGKCIAYWW